MEQIDFIQQLESRLHGDIAVEADGWACGGELDGDGHQVIVEAEWPNWPVLKI